MTEGDIRDQIVSLGKELYQRRYATGGAGNLSVKTAQNTILATPSGSCLGRLDRNALSLVDASGIHISGPPVTKEIQLHISLYRNNASCGSVVHLHPTWTTLLACRRDLEPEQVIRPFTPYFVLKVGKVKVIPYYPPGDIRIAKELEKWAETSHAFLLRNHGLIVSGANLEAAIDVMEEFEETAKLDYLLRDCKVKFLSSDEISCLLGK